MNLPLFFQLSYWPYLVYSASPSNFAHRQLPGKHFIVLFFFKFESVSYLLLDSKTWAGGSST